MTPERWQKIREVLQQAIELETGEREAYLDKVCEASLRKEVESFILSYEQAGSFLEAPPLEIPAELTADVVADPWIGRRIGAWKLEVKIGEGGMGLVYLATRADSQYRQQVAIKLIKRGMDTDFVVRRFRNERQVLANLSHPNIARLLDGGVTDDGLPYFVMEHIEGQRIDSFCDERHLTTNQRLKLFCQVCAAVQGAHQKLVIHRDIKPGNILVTAEGVPKLLDFGIAKILSPESSGVAADVTLTALRIMTPEYASPEQARGEPATPASDVYSLGVLLYELLTGHRPYVLAGRDPQHIAEVIGWREPEKPSLVVNRVEEGTGSDSGRARLTPEIVSSTREGNPDRLRRRLAGDLDNILLKALRKEPERRYGSAEELSQDIQAHLEGAPVFARGDSLTYRLGKYVRRKKTEAVAALLLFLLIAVLVGLRFAVLRERKPAPPNLRQVRSIAVLPLENLSGDPSQEYFADGMTDALITNLTKVGSLRVISRTSAMHYKGLHKPLPEIARELNVNAVIAGAVVRSGNRVRISAQLVDPKRDQNLWAQDYERDLQDVLRLQSEVAWDVVKQVQVTLTPEEQRRIVRFAHCAPNAHDLYLQGMYHFFKAAPDEYEKARDYFQRAAAADSTCADAYAGLAYYYAIVADEGLLPPGEGWIKCRTNSQKAMELDSGNPIPYIGLAATSFFYEWKFAEGEQQLKKGLQLNPGWADAHREYSVALRTFGRFDEAIAEAREAREADPFSVGMNSSLGWAYYYAHRWDDAIAQFKNTLEMDPQFLSAHEGLAKCYQQKNMDKESIQELITEMRLAGADDIAALIQGAYQSAGYQRALRVLCLTKLAQFKQAAKVSYISPLIFADLYSLLDQKDEAFDWLDRAYKERSSKLTDLKLDPDFDNLRTDPRFPRLVDRIGLP